MLNLESEGSVASLPFSTCARYVYYLGPKSVTDTVLSAVQRSRNISPPRCLTQVNVTLLEIRSSQMIDLR